MNSTKSIWCSRARVAQWVVVLPNNVYKPITNTRGFAPGCVNYIKGALDSQTQVKKLTSCLLMVGGSLRVLRLLPILKQWYRWNIAESGVKHQGSINIGCSGEVGRFNNTIQVLIISTINIYVKPFQCRNIDY